MPPHPAMSRAALTPAEVAMLRRRLERTRRQAGARAEDRDHERDLLVETTDGHAVAPVELDGDLEVATRLAGGAHDALECVDEALDRIADGTYGFCQSCSEPIGAPRLVAIPTADLCLGCQSSTEQSGRRSA